MQTVENNPFAKRMKDKPVPESLTSDANYRIFFDPPEIIQMAFGGRPWFFETGCRAVHRVGVFKGLGWELDRILTRTSNMQITGVRITHRPNSKPMKFDMVFMRREMDEEYASAPVSFTILDHRAGLLLEELKPTYAEVLGEQFV